MASGFNKSKNIRGGNITKLLKGVKKARRRAIRRAKNGDEKMISRAYKAGWIIA